MSAAPKPEPGTAVTRAEPPKGIIAVLEKGQARRIIEPLLPDGASFDRVAREVFLAAQKNREILECTVPSVITAVADALVTGGIIGRDVHLVPFNVNVAPKGQAKEWEKRLQAITDYKYKVELIVRTGAARAVDAKCVYQKEHFRYEEGIEQILEHHPIMDPKARGPMIGAYAIARLSFGNVKIEVMAIDEIEAIRKNSKQWNPERVKELPDWYAKKTVIHRLAKLLPRNERLARYMAGWQREDELETADRVERETGPLAALTPASPGEAVHSYQGEEPEPVTVRSERDGAEVPAALRAEEDELPF